MSWTLKIKERYLCWTYTSFFHQNGVHVCWTGAEGERTKNILTMYEHWRTKRGKARIFTSVQKACFPVLCTGCTTFSWKKPA